MGLSVAANCLIFKRQALKMAMATSQVTQQACHDGTLHFQVWSAWDVMLETRAIQFRLCLSKQGIFTGRSGRLCVGRGVCSNCTWKAFRCP